MFKSLTVTKSLSSVAVAAVVAFGLAGVPQMAEASGMTMVIQAEKALKKGNAEKAEKLAKTALRRGLSSSQEKRAYKVLCEVTSAEAYCKAAQ